MAIEVRVPKEITEYKEKVLFGMSMRKLACLSLAIVIGVGTYLLLTFVFHISSDAAGYIVILESAPLMALGFIEKDGMPFEKYAWLWMRHRTGKNKLHYETELIIDNMSAKASDGEIKRERKLKHAVKRKKGRAEESQIFTVSKKSRKAKCKAVRCKIKAARKDYKAAKRRCEKKAKERISPQNCAATNKI